MSSLHRRMVPLVAVLLGSVSHLALANPVDGTVAGGSASITSNGSTLTIHQSSSKAIIDWRGFDIGAGETTQFNQPSASAVTLNRVTNGGASRIDGTLKANGNLIIVNQNGVVFGQGSTVDVNSLVATTSDIRNDDFMAGNFKFSLPGNPTATIENQGAITAKEAGLVGLVAPNVINSGTINARLGRVQLASGDSFTLDLYGDGLMEVKASDALQSQLVQNNGTINAEGGSIALTAAAGAAQVNSLIDVGGTLNARGIAERDGKIYIYAEGSNGHPAKTGSSTVRVHGTLDVSNATGRGGRIDVLGDRVVIAPTAVLNADGATGGGEIHIGGDFLGAPTLPTAVTTDIAVGARISASATIAGSGGEVSVWADNRTVFDAQIDASGAGENGDGGNVETSGRVALLISEGQVRANGRRRRGEWLLDPADITITAATTSNNTGTNPYTATGTASQISAATIAGVLNAGTNVTIATSNDAFAGNGDITVSSAITATGSGSLTLSAFRNIIVNAAVTLQGGALTLRANNAGAPDGSSGVGAIVVGATINTNGGNITLGGGSGAITGAVVNADGSLASSAVGFAVGNGSNVRGVAINANVNAGGGSILINGMGASTGAANSQGVVLSSGNVLQTSGLASINVHGVGQNAGSASNYEGIAVNGTITHTGTGLTSLSGIGGGGASASSGYGITFAGAVSNTGGGSIRVYGRGGNLPTSSGHGLRLLSSNAVSTSGGGNIAVYGQGAGSNGAGVVITGPSGLSGASNAITASGGGNISVIGIGTGTQAGLTVTFSGSSITNTGGNITIRATGSSSSMTGFNTDTAGAVSASGNLTLFADRLALTQSNALSAGGVLTLAPYTNIGTSIGASVGGTLNISTAFLGYLNGGSYVFGSTTTQDGVTANTGDVTVNTTQDFGDRNVSFISGRDLTLQTTALTKATGTGTANYLFQANRNIAFTSSLTASSGRINLTVNSDYDQATALGGSIAIGSGSTITTNGGSMVFGGGTNPLTQNAYSTTTHGFSLNGVLNSGAGDIFIRGQNTGAGGNTGAVVFNSITTTTGNVSIFGTSNDTGNNGRGVLLNAGTITTGSGNVTLTGSQTSGNSSTVAVLLFTNTTGGNIVSTSGNITFDGTTSGTETGFNISRTATGTAVQTGGNVSVAADRYSLSSNFGISATGALTLATKTGVTMGIGPGSGSAANISTSQLASFSAGSYVFGSTASGDLTVNTARDFGGSNVSFISGGNISLAGTLTKATGAGAATYLLRANGNISNSGSAGIAATAGSINLTLTSDNDLSGAGNINLSNAALAVNGGTITLNSNGQSISQSGSIGGDETINSSNGAVSLGTLNGDTAGTRSLAVNAGTGTLTTTSTIGATNRLNNLNLTADDVALGGNIAGGGTLTLQPTSANRILNINTGVADGSNFNLSATEQGYLVDGWSNILIGRTDGLDSLNIGASTWTDPVTFRNNFRVQLLGNLVGTGNASVTLGGAWVNQNFSITTAGQNVTLNPATNITNLNSITTNGGSILANRPLDFTNAASSFSWLSSGGNITVGSISGSNSRSAIWNAGSGTVSFTGTVNGSHHLTVNAASATFGGSWGGSTAVGDVSLTTAGALILPSLTASSILAQTTGAAADITIAAGSTLTASGAGNAITLVAGRNFINAAATPFSLTGGGRWLVYSTNPAADTLNGLGSNFVRYGCTYGGSCPTGVTIPGAGNGVVYRTQPTLTVTPTAQNITYGNAATTSGYGYSVTSGYLTSAAGNDSTADTLSGALTAANTYSAGDDIGTYALNYSSGTLTSALGYAFTYANNASGISVGQRTLTLGLTGTVSKVYDGTTAATPALTNYSFGNIYAGDVGTLGVTGSATYDNKNVASGKTVTVNGLSLSGAKAGNYALASTTINGAVGTITPRTLAVTYSGVNRTYDGTAAATVTTSDDRVSGDVLGISRTVTFGDKNVGSGKVVSVTGVSLTGADAGNYSVASTGATTAAITPRTLAVTYSGVNRTYDGTVAATVTTSDDRVSGDVLGISRTATFGDKNVGSGKVVSVTGVSLTGADAGNYSVASTGATTATITPRTLAVTYSGVNRTYDGTVAATVTTSDDRVSGDVLGISRTAMFGDKNVGSGKVVSVTGVSLTGADAGNYSVAATGATTATITPRTLAVTYSGVNRTYDGTVAATVTTSDDRVSGDVLGISRTAMFGDKNVGSGKVVSVTGVSLTGADAGNYSVAATGATTANITPRAITLTANDQVQDYGAANALTQGVSITSGSLGTGDTISSLSYTTNANNAGNLSSSNHWKAGTYTIVASNAAGTGGFGTANYSISYIPGTLTVNQRALAVSGIVASSKVYDGTNVATVSGTANYSGIVAGDVLILDTSGATAQFIDENAGIAKTVTVTGLSLSGADAGNYSSSINASGITADITPRALLVTTADASKIAGQPNPLFSGSDNLLPVDAAQVSWVYAPVGFAGAAGSYTIAATASDPNFRLANYLRTNHYGIFTVTAAASPPQADIPASVQKWSQTATTPIVGAAGPVMPAGEIIFVTSDPVSDDRNAPAQDTNDAPARPALKDAIWVEMAPQLLEWLGQRAGSI